MLDNPPDKAVLSIVSIVSIESVAPDASGAADNAVVCVVRCLEGTARSGMVFEHAGSEAVARTARPSFLLTGIEWYGRQVERLHTVHSGKVRFKGAGAEALTQRDVLSSRPLD
ncbi:hypothetical protein GCM10010271_41070 [Streptomyces kurssanovii]|nr:hypothetical protein GCM10010271_41070 [Streptomyces kurssanovii]